MRRLQLSNTHTQKDDVTNKLLSELNKYPPLSSEEEYELGIRKDNGDSEAFDKLVRHNLRFVISVANRYSSQKGCFSLSDLVAEGTKGLIKAVKKYDPTKGFRLISYAVWYIRVAIWKFVKENNKAIKYPLNVRRYIDLSNIKANQLSQEEQYEVNAYDVMVEDYPEWAIHTVHEINPLENDGENQFPLIDIIGDVNIEPPDEKVINPSLQVAVQDAMKDFTGLEKDIINYTFGLKGDFLTLEEIAEMWCLRANWVSVVKRKILRKLSHNELLREYYEN